MCLALLCCAVPYGDPNYIQARKSAFDVGDYVSAQSQCHALTHGMVDLWPAHTANQPYSPPCLVPRAGRMTEENYRRSACVIHDVCKISGFLLLARHPQLHLTRCLLPLHLPQGFGFCANSLTLGCDCLGHIQYFDGLVSGAACSTPSTVAGASLGALSLIQQRQYLEAGR